MSEILFGLFGLSVLIGLTWLFSMAKREVDWRLVGTGVLIQILFAIFVLLTPFGAAVFDTLARGFVTLSSFTTEGARMVFGDLATSEALGFIFVFQVLPTVIFFAALTAVLYHFGVMQVVVKGMAWAITKVMKVSGAETTSVCASVFIGQTEAPLMVRPYIAKMTDSELLTMMIGGMATIAGGVMATYVMMMGGSDPALQTYYAKHFLAASVMAAPATFVIAKILCPERGEPLTRGNVRIEVEKTSVNVIDAAAAGAGDGVKLAINIAAMLLAFVALIALINALIGGAAYHTGLTGWLNAGNDPRCTSDAAFAAIAANGCTQVHLGAILGLVLAPITWVIGIPWDDALIAGGLIGQKIVLNEFIAFMLLAEVPVGSDPGAISHETRVILTYALCGFANFASIAIQIGGIGSMAPERRTDIARFGLRAVLGGSIATLMTATIAGVMINWS
ncbi:nucleoside transporter C-terminal domain-containing protein [Silanimonas sp.]|uniref:NupC/NupG family nucleoside CNT transporter n=1 Tax=Silanimonas sp. TaxID=1929290 RepID=UPI001BBF2BF1|nr:nucleoside transporter C-terminal domain-containing protein [Silanimonas sp.]MBS3897138.1 NupC/NupG family nucleoside CNT transporter [Silanimonas sp.]